MRILTGYIIFIASGSRYSEGQGGGTQKKEKLNSFLQVRISFTVKSRTYVLFLIQARVKKNLFYFLFYFIFMELRCHSLQKIFILRIGIFPGGRLTILALLLVLHGVKVAFLCNTTISLKTMANSMPTTICKPSKL